MVACEDRLGTGPPRARTVKRTWVCTCAECWSFINKQPLNSAFKVITCLETRPRSEAYGWAVPSGVRALRTTSFVAPFQRRGSVPSSLIHPWHQAHRPGPRRPMRTTNFLAPCQFELSSRIQHCPWLIHFWQQAQARPPQPRQTCA